MKKYLHKNESYTYTFQETTIRFTLKFLQIRRRSSGLRNLDHTKDQLIVLTGGVKSYTKGLLATRFNPYIASRKLVFVPNTVNSRSKIVVAKPRDLLSVGISLKNYVSLALILN
ncbi:hypothetical protein J6590_097785 [Homalodisca vitripennis]|nr:hypothetical protein J6590_097785 [Homalodisca vitripennis]